MPRASTSTLYIQKLYFLLHNGIPERGKELISQEVPFSFSAIHHTYFYIIKVTFFIVFNLKFYIKYFYISPGCFGVSEEGGIFYVPFPKGKNIVPR